ncbi:hypothetical protein K474DRAFT_1705642 [Panus rudis PR-1116 ss-1]|nr:hypothetical protein K474DRAFT_1705642 [Panus rudis PR-1116 ss-1]
MKFARDATIFFLMGSGRIVSFSQDIVMLEADALGPPTPHFPLGRRKILVIFIAFSLLAIEDTDFTFSTSSIIISPQSSQPYTQLSQEIVLVATCGDTTIMIVPSMLKRVIAAG